MQTAVKNAYDHTESDLVLVPGILALGQAEGNDIQITTSGVSPYHAKIITYFQESYLIDLDSETGTYLNGRRVMKHSLKAGDVIQLGEHCFVVRLPSKWFS